MVDFIFGLFLLSLSILFLMTSIRGLFADASLFGRAKRKDDDDSDDGMVFKNGKFCGVKILSDYFIKKIGY